jgi:hypothetical protein
MTKLRDRSRSAAKTIAALVATLLGPADGAGAYTPERPWPPADGAGVLFAHYGEEHWNDADGLTILPKVVADVARYRPRLVTMSGDKDNDGERDQLERWREIMDSYDRAGVPYFAAVGNHDRDQPPGGVPGAVPPGTIDTYADVFKGRPYPMGDAPQYSDPLFAPRERPSSDPAGAATHYFVDHGSVRWVFIDNSCWQITGCDAYQRPSAQTRPGENQFTFLERVAKEGTDAGKTVFVVMHMPTRDPGDQSYRDTIARMHTMGKSTSPDNERFEQLAAQTGVDGVFVAHIKGQFVYEGAGGVPYFIDGGAGGELYTEGPVGTDHGYWHGYRLVRVTGGRVTTDAVPVFVPDGIRIEGPASVARGMEARFEAFGRQPVFNDPAKVEALELRDPDPKAPPGGGVGASAVWEYGRWALPPALLILVGATLGSAAPRRRLIGAPATLVLVSGTAVALAQGGEPTSTPKQNLPVPARIWTTSNASVLAPVAAADDDPRRDAATQTDSGHFAARCPGRAAIEITSGWEAQRRDVIVTSAPGAIARSASAGRRRPLRAGRRGTVARVRLAQPAVVFARVLRRGRTVATLSDRCASGGVELRWDGRIRSRGKLRRARPGRYLVEVRVRSDRRPTVRRGGVRLVAR